MEERVGYGLTECTQCGDVYCRGHLVENCSAGAVGAGAIAGTSGMLFQPKPKKKKKPTTEGEVIPVDFQKQPTRTLAGANVYKFERPPLDHMKSIKDKLTNVAAFASTVFNCATFVIKVRPGQLPQEYPRDEGDLYPAEIVEFMDEIKTYELDPEKDDFWSEPVPMRDSQGNPRGYAQYVMGIKHQDGTPLTQAERLLFKKLGENPEVRKPLLGESKGTMRNFASPIRENSLEGLTQVGVSLRKVTLT